MEQDYLDIRRNIYDAIKDDYDVGDDFDAFSRDLDSEETRHNLYDAIKDDYDVGEWESFNKTIAQPSPAPVQQEINNTFTETQLENQNVDDNSPAAQPQESPTKEPPTEEPKGAKDKNIFQKGVDYLDYLVTGYFDPNHPRVGAVQGMIDNNGKEVELRVSDVAGDRVLFEDPNGKQYLYNPDKDNFSLYHPEFSVGDAVTGTDDIGRTIQGTVTTVEDQGVWITTDKGESLFCPTIEGGQPKNYAPRQQEREPVKQKEIKAGDKITAETTDGEQIELTVTKKTKEGTYVTSPDGGEYLISPDGKEIKLLNPTEQTEATVESVSQPTEQGGEPEVKQDKRSFWNKLKGLFKEQSTPILNGGLQVMSEEEKAFRNSAQNFVDEIFADPVVDDFITKSELKQGNAVIKGRNIKDIQEDFDALMDVVLGDAALRAKIEKEVHDNGYDLATYLENLHTILGQQFTNDWLAEQMAKQKPKGAIDYLFNENLLAGGLFGDAFKAIGRSPEQNQIAEMARQEYEDGISMWLKALGGGLKLVSDYWMFALGGPATKGVGKVITENTVDKVVKGYTERLIAAGAKPIRAQELAEIRVANHLWARFKNELVENIVGNALLFGSYDAAEDALNEVALNGEVNGADVLDAALGGTEMGVLLGVAGNFSRGITANLKGLRKVGAEILGFGAETAAFTTSAEIGAYKQTGEFIPLDEATLESAINLAAIKLTGQNPLLAKEVIANIRNAFKPTGDTGLHFSKDEQKILQDVFGETDILPTLEEVAVLEGQHSGTGERGGTIDNSGRLAELRQQVADGVAKIVADPEIDYETRYKLAHIIMGSDVEMPLPIISGYDITRDDQTGVTTIVTRTADGQKIKTETFKSDEKADKRKNELDKIVELQATLYQSAEEQFTKKLDNTKQTAADFPPVPQVITNTFVKERVDTQRASERLSQETIAELDANPAQTLARLAERAQSLPDGSKIKADAEEDYNVAWNYAYSKASTAGMREGLEQRINKAIKEDNKNIDNITLHNEDGTLTDNVIAVTTKDGRQGVISNGNMVVRPDGTINREKSGSFFIMMDNPDGESHALSLDDIQSINVSSASQLKAQRAGEIRREFSENFENDVNGKVRFTQDERLTLRGDDGKPFDVKILGDAIDKNGQPIEGQVMVELADGSRQMMSREDIQRMKTDADNARVTDPEFSDQIRALYGAQPANETPPTEASANEENPTTEPATYATGDKITLKVGDDEVKGRVDSVDGDNVSFTTVKKVQFEGEEEASNTHTLPADALSGYITEHTPAEPAPETPAGPAPAPETPAGPPTILQQITDKDGNIQWESVAPAQTLEALVEQAKGNKEIALEVAEGMAESAKKAVATAKGKVTRTRNEVEKAIADAQGVLNIAIEQANERVKGNDPVKMIEEREARNKAVADAQDALKKAQEDGDRAIKEAEDGVVEAQRKADHWDEVLKVARGDEEIPPTTDTNAPAGGENPPTGEVLQDNPAFQEFSSSLSDRVKSIKAPIILVGSREEMLDIAKREGIGQLTEDNVDDVNAFVVGKGENAKIYFYMPNLFERGGRTVEGAMLEAWRKIRHEGDVHFGLREMLGDERFNTLLNRTYKGMSDDLRAQFLKYCWDNNLSNIQKAALLRRAKTDNRVGKTKWDDFSDEDRSKLLALGDTRLTQEAAEEYIAHLAEKIKEDQQLTIEEKDLWDRILTWLQDVFGGSLTEEELTDLILLSHRRLENVEGEPTTEGGTEAPTGSKMFAAAYSVDTHNLQVATIRASETVRPTVEGIMGRIATDLGIEGEVPPVQASGDGATLFELATFPLRDGYKLTITFEFTPEIAQQGTDVKPTGVRINMAKKGVGTYSDFLEGNPTYEEMLDRMKRLISNNHPNGQEIINRTPTTDEEEAPAEDKVASRFKVGEHYSIIVDGQPMDCVLDSKDDKGNVTFTREDGVSGQMKADDFEGILAPLNVSGDVPLTPESAAAQGITETQLAAHTPEWLGERGGGEKSRRRGYRQDYGYIFWRKPRLKNIKTGSQTLVDFGGGMDEVGRMALIELSDLQASHNMGVPNPYHFISEAQPKDRTDTGSINAALENGRKLKNEQVIGTGLAFSGAPVINARGEVIQGNSRADALRVAYRDYPEKIDVENPDPKILREGYRDQLRRLAHDYGLDAADVDRMENPVLVRLLDVDDDRAIALGKMSQKDAETGSATKIDAALAASRLGKNVQQVANILFNEGGRDTSDWSLSDFLTANGKEVLDYLVGGNPEGIVAISQTDYSGAFNGDGNVSAAAKEAIRDILFQSVFGDLPNATKNVFNGSEFPDKARKALYGAIFNDFMSPEGERLIPTIQEAISAYADIVASQYKKDFLSANTEKSVKRVLDAWRRGTVMNWGNGSTSIPSQKYSPFSIDLAGMFRYMGQNELKKALNETMYKVRQSAEPDIFLGSEPITLEKALGEEFKKYLPEKYEVKISNKQLKADDNTTLFSIGNANNVEIEPVEITDDKGRKSLVGVHNMYLNDIYDVLRNGGMLSGMSSAVIDIDNGMLHGYGPATFVMYPEMIDSRTGRNAGTFAGDAYTPSNPRTEMRISESGRERMQQDIQSIPSEEARDYVRQGLERWSAESASRGYRAESPAKDREIYGLKLLFLHEKGIDAGNEINGDQEMDSNGGQLPSADVIDEYIRDHNLRKEYTDWFNTLRDRYGAEEFIYNTDIPATTENVLRYKQGRADQNGGSPAGTANGNTYGQILKHMETIDDIIAEKHRLTPNYDIDLGEFNNKWRPVREQVIEAIDKALDSTSGRGVFYDAIIQPDPQKYLKDEYGIELPKEDVKAMNDFIDAVRNEMPAEYFETWSDREVGLNEFAGAVVPDSFPSDVIDALRELGLEVETYEAGDMRDRLAKVRELANERDDVRFSVGDEGESRVGFEPRSIDDLSEDEKAELGDFVLGGNYVSELTGGEFPRTGERGIVDRIANYYKEKYNGLVTREGLGDVELDRRGVKDSINHIRITNKNIAAFAAVPDIIERGYIIDHKEDWQERGYETTTIAAPIKIGNGSFVGVVVVRKGQKTQTFRFYLHRITPQKYLLDESPTDTEADTRQEGIANVLRKIANAKKNRDNLTKNNGQEPEARFSIGDSNEVYEIIRRAKENGTLGKAPNGQPSKLVEIGNQFGYSGGNKLWARVRTPQFKSWFGDWENGEGSKVLDENGEPLVVYHGSRTGGNFTVFGGESFFTDNRDVAEMFRDDASYIMRVNGGEPVVIFGHDARELAEDLTKGDYDADDLSNWGEIDIDNLDTADIPQYRKEHLAEDLLGLRDFNDLKTLSIRKAGPVFETFLNIRNPLVVDFANEEWSVDNRVEPSFEEAKRAGYDGIIVRNIVEGGPAAQLLDGREVPPATVFVTFEPNQVKSVTNDNPTENADIRFSIGDTASTLGRNLGKEIDVTNEGRREQDRYVLDPETGKISLVSKNNRTAKDAERSILTALTQRGNLRETFGEEEYNDFIDDIYQQSGEETRREITDIAMRNGLDFRKATEQYLADTVTSDNFDPNSPWWRTIKRDFQAMIGARGFNETTKRAGFGEEGGLSDNDLRYIFWKNYRNDGTNRGAMGVAEDVAMQDELGVGNYAPVEPEVRFSAGEEMTGDERLGDTIDRLISTMKTYRDDLEARNDAMQGISDAFHAIQAQGKYDRATVQTLTDAINEMIKEGLLDPSRGDTKRLLSSVKNSMDHSVGGNETRFKNAIYSLGNVLADNQLRVSREALEDALRVKTEKVNQSGIKTQGTVDADTAQIIRDLRKLIFGESSERDYDEDNGNKIVGRENKEQLEKRISDAARTMSDPSRPEAERNRAALEATAARLAISYLDKVDEPRQTRQAMRKEAEDYYDFLKKAVEDGTMTASEARSLRKDYDEALRDRLLESKFSSAAALHDIAQEVTSIKDNGIEKAKNFFEKDLRMRQTRTYDLLEDLGGVENTAQKKVGIGQSAMNTALAQITAAPLLTYEQLFKLLGRNSADGQGFLYNRYVGGWFDAANKEAEGYQDSMAKLNAKAAELFGKGTRYTDLYGLTHKTLDYTLSFYDNGTPVERKLTVGNLLYIYMVNKMTDGIMKLRRMGINSEKVAQIKESLDPRLIELADWIQEEFLPQTRARYNETYKELYGTSMDDIPNYVPLNILSNAIPKDDVLSGSASTENIGKLSTVTSAIKTRTVNSMPIDLVRSDGLSIIFDHVEEMEHWSAFAPLAKDLNGLLGDPAFRNRVMNMTTLYGAGEPLLQAVENVCRQALGDYSPERGNKLERGLSKFGQAVASSKIAFRLNTALKQFISMANYIPDVNLVDFSKAIGQGFMSLGGKNGTWQWCMENLPLFKKRWESRTSGDTRLVLTDSDFAYWRKGWVEKLRRWGITPNAFIDAVTVSIGAKAIYDTKYKQYIKDGYNEEQADKKAKQDAVLLYNQTQQSAEGAFISTMQSDRTVISMAATLFRNASMSYTRQVVQASRNLLRIASTPKGQMIESMKGQYLQDGLTDEQAQAAAERRYNRTTWRELTRLGVFWYIAPFLWRAGGHWLSSAARLLPTLWGQKVPNADDERQQWIDDAVQSAWGPLEGLPFGNGVSDEVYSIVTEKGPSWKPIVSYPLFSDYEEAREHWKNTNTFQAINDAVNLGASIGLGASPQALEDAIYGMIDYCGSEYTARDALILLSSLTSMPHSQINKIRLDALDLSGEEALQMTPEEFVKRYADAQKEHNAGVFTPLMGEKESKKYEKAAQQKVKEELSTVGGVQLNREYDTAMEQYNAMKNDVSAINKELKADEENLSQEEFDDKYGAEVYNWLQKGRKKGRYKVRREQLMEHLFNEKYGEGKYAKYKNVAAEDDKLNSASGKKEKGKTKEETVALATRWMNAKTPEEELDLRKQIEEGKRAFVEASKELNKED